MKFTMGLIRHALRHAHPEKLVSYFGPPAPAGRGKIARAVLEFLTQDCLGI